MHEPLDQFPLATPPLHTRSPNGLTKGSSAQRPTCPCHRDKQKSGADPAPTLNWGAAPKHCGLSPSLQGSNEHAPSKEPQAVTFRSYPRAARLASDVNAALFPLPQFIHPLLKMPTCLPSDCQQLGATCKLFLPTNATADPSSSPPPESYACHVVSGVQVVSSTQLASPRSVSGVFWGGVKT